MTKSIKVLFAGTAIFVFSLVPLSARSEEFKPVMIHHLFTGPDGLTHVEEIEAKFAGASSGSAFYNLAAGRGRSCGARQQGGCRTGIRRRAGNM